MNGESNLGDTETQAGEELGYEDIKRSWFESFSIVPELPGIAWAL